MSQKRYLRIPNFDEQLHYKDRNPIWIKMPYALLDDYDFEQLSDETKFHAMGLMLLASHQNNKFPEDAAWLKRKIGANSEIDLKILLEKGFLEVITSENSSKSHAKKSAKNKEIGCKSNKTQDHLASTTSETLLAQNRTEQNKKEQNTTQQNTADETRSREKALDAENRVAVVGVVENFSENPNTAEDVVSKNGRLSQFSFDECLRYVKICESRGEKIRNPQGLATSFYKSGRADAFIRAELYPQQQAEIGKEIYGNPRVFSDEPCRVCYGAKMEIVPNKGARPCPNCKDERGKATGFEPLFSGEW